MNALPVIIVLAVLLWIQTVRIGFKKSSINFLKDIIEDKELHIQDYHKKIKCDIEAIRRLEETVERLEHETKVRKNKLVRWQKEL